MLVEGGSGTRLFWECFRFREGRSLLFVYISSSSSQPGREGGRVGGSTSDLTCFSGCSDRNMKDEGAKWRTSLGPSCRDVGVTGAITGGAGGFSDRRCRQRRERASREGVDCPFQI